MKCTCVLQTIIEHLFEDIVSLLNGDPAQKSFLFCHKQGFLFIENNKLICLFLFSVPFCLIFFIINLNMHISQGLIFFLLGVRETRRFSYFYISFKLCKHFGEPIHSHLNCIIIVQYTVVCCDINLYSSNTKNTKYMTAGKIGSTNMPRTRNEPRLKVQY